MLKQVNFEKYLKRIGVDEKPTPDLINLKKIQRNHLLSIPFENLDIHENRRITLDLNRIYVKIVEQNRGGFCYELNGLLYQLLIQIGFKAKMISASVYKDGIYGPKYDHLSILVQIDSRTYLVDVGFGEFAFGPIQLLIGQRQEDERGIFSIDQYRKEYFRVNKLINDLWVPEYIFKDQGRHFEEFEVMCSFHQESEASHFTQKRLITIPIEDGRITLTNNTLKTRTGDLVVEKEIEKGQLQRTLVNKFGFNSKV